MSDAPLIREISAAREEFARGIRAGFADAQTTPGGWQVRWQSASATIALSPLPELVIASLRLPRQRCVITLTDGTVPDRQALLTRLDRYQQRGGG
jgi:hypothetical protein